MLTTILTYTLIPAVITIIGGIIAAYRAPGEKTRIAVQHFAAGVVFAAVAVELLPDLTRDFSLVPVVIGFSLGVALMLFVRHITAKTEKGGGTKGSGSLVTSAGLDIFIDGLLMGVSFSIGVTQGLILTLALTIELLFLVISVTSSLAKRGKSEGSIILVTLIFGFLVVFGAFMGGYVLSGLSGFGFELVVAFAIAALLYLVTEELLVEAHEGKDNSFATAMFFAGFLMVIVLDSLISG
ncbi:MAG: hypothetical protein MI861_14435 [Pirellulales bacterium]|nr:hypothetical protein [Pirellulales bacterium]